MEVLGTFAQYKESKSKASLAKPAEPAHAMPPPQAAKPHKQELRAIQQLFAQGNAQQKKDAQMGNK